MSRFNKVQKIRGHAIAPAQRLRAGGAPKAKQPQPYGGLTFQVSSPPPFNRKTKLATWN